MKKPNLERLALWQSRLAQSDAAFSGEIAKMDQREKLYRGNNELKPLVPGDTTRSGDFLKTSHVRNIIFENIESQVSTLVPQPKVTPRRKKDEHLARTIEHFLRNELDRLPTEAINDMAERTVPVQGGVGYLVEWDNSQRTHTTVGEICMSMIHPKQMAPQPGVYTSVEDMDWFIVKEPTTKSTVKRKYGVDVYDESESEPDIRGVETATVTDEALTQYIGFEKAAGGGLNKFSWVNDKILEDLENYQARRQPVCTKCGRVRPLPGQVISNTNEESAGADDSGEQMAAGMMLAQKLAGMQMEADIPDATMDGVGFGDGSKPVKYDGGACPWCGCEKFEDEVQEYERIMLPIKTARGTTIPGMHPGVDESGLPTLVPTLVPFYCPDMYPIIVQKSVSVFGQFLGNSDVDAIEDQQNTVNRLEQKIIDRLMKAGTRITMPDRPDLRTDPVDGERWYLDSAAEKQMIDVLDFSGNLQYEMAYLEQVYQESRQILGVTDSFQGRRDPTATSGVAKEYSAAQAAGRFESKRAMKLSAYAQIFEMMFKLALAYSDEPRPVSFKNFRGETEYEEFNRYDFLEQDADGSYFWNDQFLFSIDGASPLASNREAMWQETRMNLQTGAFGDPTSTETLILFWDKMDALHYPGAGQTKQYLEAKLQQERMLQQEMALQQEMTKQAVPPEETVDNAGQIAAGTGSNPTMPEQII
ncbi:MAG: hypothetical protein ACI3W5_07460 [Faecousia sp.]